MAETGDGRRSAGRHAERRRVAPRDQSVRPPRRTGTASRRAYTAWWYTGSDAPTWSLSSADRGASDRRVRVESEGREFRPTGGVLGGERSYRRVYPPWFDAHGRESERQRVRTDEVRCSRRRRGAHYSAERRRGVPSQVRTALGGLRAASVRRRGGRRTIRSERNSRIAVLQASLSRPSPPPSSPVSRGRTVALRISGRGTPAGTRVEGRCVREAVVRDRPVTPRSPYACAADPWAGATRSPPWTARTSRQRVYACGRGARSVGGRDRRRGVDRSETVVEGRPNLRADGHRVPRTGPPPRRLRDGGQKTPIPGSFVVTPTPNRERTPRRRLPTSRTWTLKVTSVVRRDGGVSPGGRIRDARMLSFE